MAHNLPSRVHYAGVVFSALSVRMRQPRTQPPVSRPRPLLRRPLCPYAGSIQDRYRVYRRLMVFTPWHSPTRNCVSERHEQVRQHFTPDGAAGFHALSALSHVILGQPCSLPEPPEPPPEPGNFLPVPLRVLFSETAGVAGESGRAYTAAPSWQCF